MSKLFVVFLLSFVTAAQAQERTFSDIMSEGARELVPLVLETRADVNDLVATFEDWQQAGITTNGTNTVTGFNDFVERRDSYLETLQSQSTAAIESLQSLDELAMALLDEILPLYEFSCSQEPVDARACPRMLAFREAVGSLRMAQQQLLSVLVPMSDQMQRNMRYLTDDLQLYGLDAPEALMNSIGHIEELIASKRKMMPENRWIILNYDFGETSAEHYPALMNLNRP